MPRQMRWRATALRTWPGCRRDASSRPITLHASAVSGRHDVMIEVTLLGTGSPMVDPHRAGPSTLVRASDHTFLVDCGRGVLMRAAAVGVGAADITALLLTHLHS